MLLPDKHITFAESLLGLGTFILESLSVPKTVDSLWAEFEKVRGEKFPAYHSFDNLILAIDMLYACL
ncbi:ABC-three component system middle component 6, partial [Candidatus Albibeggiatoa sp. nov. BB20]|uniref:ABC-three component system middle component 6 n=1 Tax=Candidatus Albibeggiatoa sp. nov. BB20 TaxID=3162723 RepID=UPI003365AF26